MEKEVHCIIIELITSHYYYIDRSPIIFANGVKMNLEIKCLCGCDYVTELEGDFPMILGVEAYYCLKEHNPEDD